MDKGKLKGHAALWVANIVWGLNAPIGKKFFKNRIIRFLAGKLAIQGYGYNVKFNIHILAR